MAAACFYNIGHTNSASAEEIGSGTVTSVPLNYVTITQYPTKTTYTQGESLDLTGMVLQGNYSDGTTQQITDYTVSGFSSNTIGSQNVMIYYQGISIFFNVMVLPAKVTGITVTSSTNNSVTLTWNAAPETVRYEIYIYNSFNGSYVLNNTTSTNSITLSYAPATAFQIEICAIGNSGGMEYRGSFSDPFTAATLPEATTGLMVTGISASSVSLSWNPVSVATGYIVYRSKNKGVNYSLCAMTTTAAYEDIKVSSGTAYQYKVCAYTYSENFTGIASNVVDISTNPAKMLLKCKPGEQKMRITWNKVTGASYYDIYIGDDMNGYSLLTTRKAKYSCAYLVEGLTKGQTYNIYAVARRIYKGTEYKGETSATTAVLITDIAATSTDAKIYLTKDEFVSSMPYNDIAFFKKYVKYSKSFIMPGLVTTNIGGFESTAMCPQGITFAGNYLLLTAYDMKSEENSVIYVMDKSTKALLTTLILPSKTHAGGIVYDGSNIWVSNGVKISSIPYAQVEAAVLAGTPYNYVTYNATCEVGITASYLTYYMDQLWVGTYNELENTQMYSYQIEDKDTRPMLIKSDSIVMPTRVQGVAFTDKGVLIMSRSCQLYDGLRGYIRQLDLYQPDFDNVTNGEIALGDVINSYEMPSMNEGIAIDGSYLYVCYESAAFQDASYKMDRVCAFSLSSLIKKIS
jgi:hypothetical protein